MKKTISIIIISLISINPFYADVIFSGRENTRKEGVIFEDIIALKDKLSFNTSSESCELISKSDVLSVKEKGTVIFEGILFCHDTKKVIFEGMILDNNKNLDQTNSNDILTKRLSINYKERDGIISTWSEAKNSSFIFLQKENYSKLFRSSSKKNVLTVKNIKLKPDNLFGKIHLSNGFKYEKASKANLCKKKMLRFIRGKKRENILSKKFEFIISRKNNPELKESDPLLRIDLLYYDQGELKKNINFYKKYKIFKTDLCIIYYKSN